MTLKAEKGMEEGPYCFSRPLAQFQGHIGQTRSLGWSQLSNPSDLPCFRSFIKFLGHTGWKIDDFNPVWVRLLGRSQPSNPTCSSVCSQHGVYSGLWTWRVDHYINYCAVSMHLQTNCWSDWAQMWWSNWLRSSMTWFINFWSCSTEFLPFLSL